MNSMQPRRRLRNAQASAPFMVAGSDRLDTQLLEAGQGRLQVKMGAEGVYLGAIADREIGFALKCEEMAHCEDKKRSSLSYSGQLVRTT